MASSRETVRDALVALLEPALVGVGLPAKTVQGSKPTTLKALTPLVAVLSAGANRVPFTYEGNRPYFDLVIQTWVLQSDGAAWTPALAEDALDDIEAIIAGVLETNLGTDDWTEIDYKGPSRIVQWSVAGVPHYVELTPVRAMLARS